MALSLSASKTTGTSAYTTTLTISTNSVLTIYAVDIRASGTFLKTVSLSGNTGSTTVYVTKTTTFTAKAVMDSVASNAVICSLTTPTPTPTPSPTPTPTPTPSPTPSGTLTVKVSPVGSGTVQQTLISTASNGKTISFKAIPASGYRFEKFTDTWYKSGYGNMSETWTDNPHQDFIASYASDVITAFFVPTGTTPTPTPTPPPPPQPQPNPPPTPQPQPPGTDYSSIIKTVAMAAGAFIAVRLFRGKKLI